MPGFNKIAFNKSLNSKRLFDETDDFRSPFQRDRDRILHSNAFRRLAHKTQVFLSTKKQDHFRNRLTHSLEVSQIARSISSIIGVDENLTEAIALSHDLGHPPFGHIGENILNDLMKKLGHQGFDHNIQTLRILTFLEKKYALFDGLNLTFETLDGVLKHSGPIKNQKNYYLVFSKKYGLLLDQQSSMESQVAALSDDIAYNCHDIDDGIRAGLFNLDDLRQINIIDDQINILKNKYPDINNSRLIHELKRSLINSFIIDATNQIKVNIDENKISNHMDVISCKKMIVQLSLKIKEQMDDTRSFLQINMYQNDEVLSYLNYAEDVIIGLFYFYKENLNKLHVDLDNDYSTRNIDRVICDFISGMTDNYAIKKYKELVQIK
jgi:dGTPase